MEGKVYHNVQEVINDGKDSEGVTFENIPSELNKQRSFIYRDIYEKLNLRQRLFLEDTLKQNLIRNKMTPNYTSVIQLFDTEGSNSLNHIFGKILDVNYFGYNHEGIPALIQELNNLAPPLEPHSEPPNPGFFSRLFNKKPKYEMPPPTTVGGSRKKRKSSRRRGSRRRRHRKSTRRRRHRKY
jgi:hypothetical protein